MKSNLFLLLMLSLTVFSSISISQTSEPLIGGGYLEGKGFGGIIAGSKPIAKVEITLTPKDEYGTEINSPRSKTFIGPLFAYQRSNFSFPRGFLGRFPSGFITRIKIYYSDRTVRVYNRNDAQKMVGNYFEYIGSGN